MSIKDIEARVKAPPPGTWEWQADVTTTDFIRHAREDIPYLLAQLKARDKTIAAMNREYHAHGYSHADHFLEAVGDILKGGE